MKKLIFIILSFISLQVNAQWNNFNAFGLQRKIVSGDTTWRFVGSGSNGFRLFNPNGGSTIAGYGLLGSGTIYADSTVLRSWSNSLSLAQLQTRFNLKQNTVSLTTTGSSGVATFNPTTGALNIPNYAVPSGEKAITGNETFTSATGYGSANTYNLDTVLSDTLYSVYIQIRSASAVSGSYVLPIKISRTTSTFTVNIQAGSGTPTGTLNWLVLPTGWNGTGGGGGGGYTLPIASASVLGGVKVGTGLNIDGGGVLSATGGATPDTTIYRTVSNSFTKAQSQPRITLTTTGGSGAAAFNAATGALNIPIYTGGGGGSVSQVTSANTDISVANTTSTPVLTLNSGLSADQIVKRGTGGRIPVLSTTEYFVGSSGNIDYQATTSHTFKNSSTTLFGANVNGISINSGGMKINNSTGRLGASGLSTSLTAPTQTGTIKLAVSDVNGDISWVDLTTTGSSGASTLASGSLNIPQYSGGGGTPDTTVYRTVANSFTKAQAQPRITLTTTGSGVATFNAGTGALNIPTPSSSTTNLALGTGTSTTYPITNSNGTGFTLPSATTSVAGLLSAADKITINAIGSLGAGDYTPTLTTSTNVASLAQSYANYIRVGNQVTVQGGFRVSFTAGSTLSQFYIALPVASALVYSKDLNGQCVSISNPGNKSVVGVIQADTGGGRAYVTIFSDASDITTQDFRYSFTYTVI